MNSLAETIPHVAIGVRMLLLAPFRQGSPQTKQSDYSKQNRNALELVIFATSLALVAEIAHAWPALSPNLATAIPFAIRVGVIMLLSILYSLPTARIAKSGISDIVLFTRFMPVLLLGISLAEVAYRAAFLHEIVGTMFAASAARLAFDTWLCWMQFQLAFRSKDIQKSQPASSEYCPEESESYLSLIAYGWVWRRLVSKLDHSGTLADTIALPRHLQSENTLSGFTKHWNQELDSGRKSLAHAILRTSLLDMFMVSGLYFLHVTKELATPLITSRLMHQLAKEDISTHAAYKTLAVFVALSVGGTLLQQNSIDLKDKATLRLRVALTTSIHHQVLYRPGLASVAAAGGTDLYSCGLKSTQALATHVFKLCEVLWVPVRLATALYVFYLQVGWALASGIVVIIAYIPLRNRIFRWRNQAYKSFQAAGSKRIALLTQLVENIVPLRMLGWEQHLVQQIQSVREGAELTHAMSYGLSCAINWGAAVVNSSGIPAVSLFIYCMVANWLVASGDSGSLGNKHITVERVYIVQAMLRELIRSIQDFPSMLDRMWSANLPYRNISQLLTAGTDDLEISEKRTVGEPNSKFVVEISSGVFKWQAAPASADSDTDTGNGSRGTVRVNFKCEPGQMVAVAGKVGACKSSFLSAILGEMDHISGIMLRPSSGIAYVSQEPWLSNSTIRSNITFGKGFEPEWYAKVIGACELKYDLDRMPDGDQTVVGDNGIALSGGQRLRIALARAVYSRAELYLLDNIFSAVDVHVGNRLFDNVVSSATGLLKHTSRIIVSNEVSVLARTDAVSLAVDGEIRDPVPFNQLLSESSELRELVESRKGCGECASLHLDLPPVPSLNTPPDSIQTDMEYSGTGSDSSDEREISSDITDYEPKFASFMDRFLIPARYMVRTCGFALILCQLVTVIVQFFIVQGSQQWLAKPIPIFAPGTASNTASQASWMPTLHNPTTAHFAISLAWLAAEATIEFGGRWWPNVVWRRFMFVKTHRELMDSVSNASLPFFSAVPTGRILGLFTESQGIIDKDLPELVGDFMNHATQLVFETWVIFGFHPIMPVAVAVLLIAMIYIIKVSRKPLDNFNEVIAATNPRIQEQYQQSLDGAATIRAFSNQAYASKLMFDRLDDYSRAKRSEEFVYTWVDLSISALREMALNIAYTVTVLGISGGARIDYSHLVAIRLVTAHQMARFQHLTHKSYNIRTGFTKSARYLHYCSLESENVGVVDGEPVEESWPAKGQVVFDSVTARYSANGKHVLDGMSFTIKPRQHVGVVGRTGAGKTSIAMTLFGLLKPSSGRILLDGVDIATVDLHTLRSRLGVVPQTSVLLAGTVRDNLDPFRKYADSEIRRCLAVVGMPDVPLTSEVLSNGGGWSVGQQQQICLARVLLKRPKVLVMDESTAAIDGATSSLLHKLIRKEFKECTVISIAHRVESVLDSDVILVVDDGRICESGPLQILQSDPNSHFARLVQRSAEMANQRQ